jgi:hypothetical protein
MSRKKSKHRKKTPLTDPNQNRTTDSKNDASVRVHGAIEAHPPESLIKQHNTERKEDNTAHVAERNEDRLRDTYKLLLEGATFLAVVFYAGIAWWQGCLMKQTVQITRDNFIVDQRAWISVSIPNFFPLDGPTIPLKIQIVDTGKTIARNVRGSFIATVLNKGDMPPFDQFDDGHPHNVIHAPAVFPTATPPLEAVVTVMQYGPKVPEVIVPTQELRDKILKSGESYIVILGKITYCDVFRVKHSTTFCHGGGKALEVSGVKECIAYNDVDTNITPTADCQ